MGQTPRKSEQETWSADGVGEEGSQAGGEEARGREAVWGDSAPPTLPQDSAGTGLPCGHGG